MKITITDNGHTCTVESPAEDVYEAVNDVAYALMGMGYNPLNVADALAEIGEEHGDAYRVDDGKGKEE